MSLQDFVDGLRELGFAVRELGDGRVAFPYEVPVGKFIGQTVTLGFTSVDGFPANPPGGPHLSPRLLPLQSGGEHPAGQIHKSPFGDDWEYWSRPFNGWARTGRSAREYMAFIRRLFETQ